MFCLHLEAVVVVSLVVFVMHHTGHLQNFAIFLFFIKLMTKFLLHFLCQICRYWFW